MVEPSGIACAPSVLSTESLRGVNRAAVRCRSNHQMMELTSYGGAKRDRTADLLLARQALSQLSYGPVSVLKCPILHISFELMFRCRDEDGGP
jgi:hypothetical protein